MMALMMIVKLMMKIIDDNADADGGADDSD